MTGNFLMDLWADGHGPTRAQAFALATCDQIDDLMTAAGKMRDLGHGQIISYSKKVFIPVTKLCRDSCHYCTFAKAPSKTEPAYMSLREILAVAQAGARAGCREALFTLGDKPELRYVAARRALTKLGHDTTLSYVMEAARLVFAKTGLFVHINAGVMSLGDIEALKDHSISQGLMLETLSDRLSQKGGPHFGSPDKHPATRLATIEAAGKAGVPFTSGLLIGIGETRTERIAALLALRDLHQTYGHIQEIIIQPFRAKLDTRMAQSPDATLAEHLWTIAAARLILGPEANIQAPPNLSAGALGKLILAGLNDWGGISPVTPDHVNPEAPWPNLSALERKTAHAGKILVERLAVYPSYVHDVTTWLNPTFRAPVLQAVDTQGFARTDDWIAGAAKPPPAITAQTKTIDHETSRILRRALDGHAPVEAEIVRLFAARNATFSAVCETADRLRRRISGNRVGYVVNRNINYTNVCSFKCGFCAFSKGTGTRGEAYVLEPEEIVRRAEEAWLRGATEVCLQGGIHPAYTGAFYLDVCRAVKAAVPDLHVHAFSPLEISHGAASLNLTIERYLKEMIATGLGSLPGTAAEILDDEIRAIICPDKLTTKQWLQVMTTAHGTGLRATATIMFGHVDRPVHWARHLLRLLGLQKNTGVFTEFVPLAFVHMEAPIYLKGLTRRGPTWRETILMHAVARLVFQHHIPNIQASWVKLGPEGLRLCLAAGANDAGGTLMNETITRSAGAVHGQEMAPARLEALIKSAGRAPYQRTTLYQTAPAERISTARNPAPLGPVKSSSPHGFGKNVSDRKRTLSIAPAAD